MFKKGNKGITLIALVITIIVLLILAGITIAQITGQDSAPEKAAQAKVENERGAAKDAATMLVTEKIQGYYEDKYVKVPAATTATNQLAYIAEKLGSGVTTGDYTVTVTAAGTITVTKGTETLATGTVSNDGVITWEGNSSDGDETGNLDTVESLAKDGQIKRWDKINYNPGSGTTASVNLPAGAKIEGTKLASLNLPAGATLRGTINASDASDWVVLDVNQTTGEILIMPKNVSETTLTLTGKDGYNNAIQALDSVAGIYLNTDYATNARSITEGDINKVEGYTPLGYSATYKTRYKTRYGMDSNLDITDTGEGNEVLQTFTSDPLSDNIRDYNLTKFPFNMRGFLASRAAGYYSGDGKWGFVVKTINGNTVRSGYDNGYWTGRLFAIDLIYNGPEQAWSCSRNVIPVVSLKSNIQLEKRLIENEAYDSSSESSSSYSSSSSSSLSSYNEEEKTESIDYIWEFK